MTQTTKSIAPLRQRMIDDMACTSLTPPALRARGRHGPLGIGATAPPGPTGRGCRIALTGCTQSPAPRPRPSNSHSNRPSIPPRFPSPRLVRRLPLTSLVIHKVPGRRQAASNP